MHLRQPRTPEGVFLCLGGFYCLFLKKALKCEVYKKHRALFDNRGQFIADRREVAVTVDDLAFKDLTRAIEVEGDIFTRGVADHNCTESIVCGGEGIKYSFEIVLSLFGSVIFNHRDPQVINLHF